jgi:eukaryotic-like serine/threonine-protein kinase
MPNVEPGALLGGTYRLVRRIGSGGMGEVYEATHARLAHRYAIKFLHPGMRNHPEALPRFMREAQVTARLRHPGIVSVVDFNTLPDGIAYLVMEYLDGEPLGKVLARSGPLPLPRIVDITDQLSSALTAAHLEGVVHRDMHPQNVFVVPASSGQGERVKILDFGISKIAAISQKITGAATVLGTPQYMSPEQVEGKTDELDAASDQFSVAAIVYEMLTGRPAFEGATLASVAYQIVHATPPPIQKFRPELPAELDPVLSRALAKNKKDRFPSVSEFAVHFRWTAALPANARGAALRAESWAGNPEDEPTEIVAELEETTAVSAVPSGMAEVLRQTSGLSAHPAEPGPEPAPSGRGTPGARSAEAVHSDPTLVSSSPFAADDPSLMTRGPFVPEELPARGWGRGAGARQSFAVVGVLIAAVAIGLVVRTRTRVRSPDAVAPGPAPAATAPLPSAVPSQERAAGAREATPAPQAEDPSTEANAPTAEVIADRKSTPRGHARAVPAAKGAAPAIEPPSGPANCRITVGSYPWSDLWIDGADTGLQTPVVDLPVACGIHRLEFKRSDLKVDQVERVTLDEGHRFKRQYDLVGASPDE